MKGSPSLRSRAFVVVRIRVDRDEDLGRGRVRGVVGELRVDIFRDRRSGRSSGRGRGRSRGRGSARGAKVVRLTETPRVLALLALGRRVRRRGTMRTRAPSFWRSEQRGRRRRR